MDLKNQLISAFVQLGAVLILCACVFLIYKLLPAKQKAKKSFFAFVGMVFSKKQFDSIFWTLLAVLIVFGFASAYLQYTLSPSLRSLMMSETSPIGKILISGVSPSAVLAAFIYCFIQAGAAEELLFRGLIAKKLFNSFGFVLGNIAQAAVFWLMHLMMFRFVTGEWFNFPQVIAFITSFGLGLVFGYANYRKQGPGIGPSWILHSAVNYASFLGVAFAVS